MYFDAITYTEGLVVDPMSFSIKTVQEFQTY